MPPPPDSTLWAAHARLLVLPGEVPAARLHLSERTGLTARKETAPYTYPVASGRTLGVRRTVRAATAAYREWMTTTYAALLRGINVGGARKLPMADLRTLMEGLGLGGVRSYLQSGQAVFSSAHGDEDSLAADIAGAIERQAGFAVDVIVRDHVYLKAVVDDCPFPAAGLEGRQLHVTYLSEPVGAERYAEIDPAVFHPEEFRLGDRALYLYAPDGLGRSKLAQALTRPRLNRGLVATTRNWNTAVKLAEMTGPPTVA